MGAVREGEVVVKELEGKGEAAVINRALVRADSVLARNVVIKSLIRPGNAASILPARNAVRK